MTHQTANLVNLSLRAGTRHIEASFNALGARQVSLSVNGRQAMQPYYLNEVPPFATGFTMAPWANRMRDGRWADAAGNWHQNPVSEARTNTALHGLLLDTVYRIADQTESSVTFETDLLPSDGYPFHLTIRVRYILTEDGLTATHSAVNHSDKPAPFGTGAHPYLYFDGLTTADLEMSIPAQSWTSVDDRLLPVATEPIATFPISGDALAAGDSVRLGDFCIDNDFLNLQRGPDGLAVTTLHAPESCGDARKILIWQDEAFPHVHVFSCDFYPDGVGGVQHGITIEPVTAGPDAFNTGLDLIQLSPEVEWSGSWGIRLLNW